MEQRGLASARFSGQGHALAWFHRKLQAAEDHQLRVPGGKDLGEIFGSNGGSHYWYKLSKTEKQTPWATNAHAYTRIRKTLGPFLFVCIRGQMFSKFRAGCRDGQAAVLHSLGADEDFGDLLDLTSFASHHQDFEAVVVVQVHVKRREDEAMVFVLQVREPFVQQADVVVVDQRNRADHVAVGDSQRFSTRSLRMRSRKASERLV